MSVEVIYYIILSLLSFDNAQGIDKSHIMDVSKAIHKHSTSSVPAVRLISLAYNESRFGYKGKKVISNMGACGIYQQIPKWSPIKTTCKKLNTSVDHSTKVAVATLGRMIDRWDIKGSKNMDKRMCHYYSGNRCDDEARAYSKRHRKIRLKAINLSKKKYKSKIAKKSKSKKSNNSKPKYRMPPRYMTL